MCTRWCQQLVKNANVLWMFRILVFQTRTIPCTYTYGLFWGLPRSHRLSSHSRLNAFVIQTKPYTYNIRMMAMSRIILNTCQAKTIYPAAAMVKTLQLNEYSLQRRIMNQVIQIRMYTDWNTSPHSVNHSQVPHTCTNKSQMCIMLNLGHPQCQLKQTALVNIAAVYNFLVIQHLSREQKWPLKNSKVGTQTKLEDDVSPV